MIRRPSGVDGRQENGESARNHGRQRIRHVDVISIQSGRTIRPMTTLECGIETKLCKDGRDEGWLGVERETYSAYEFFFFLV